MSVAEAFVVFPIIGILCVLTALLVWDWLNFHSKRWRSLTGKCDCEFCTMRRDYERTKH